MPVVDLSIATIDYRVFGPDSPDAPTAVFVHGFLVHGALWDSVAERLAAAGIRCIVPDWPLGSHRTPAHPDVELSPTTVARAVLQLLDVLDLHDVTLVGNDSGGAICQLAIKGDHHRIGGLVLTNCDAFEHFPPAFFVPLFIAARFRAAVWLVVQTTRLRFLRHSPLAYGRLLRRPRPADLTRGWVQPAIDDRRIRRDITRFARGVERTELVDSPSWLATFDKPARLVWGTRDGCFTIADGRRLAEVLPQAELEEVADATTFVSIDRPDAVASAVQKMTEQVRNADPRPR